MTIRILSPEEAALRDALVKLFRSRGWHDPENKSLLQLLSEATAEEKAKEETIGHLTAGS